MPIIKDREGAKLERMRAHFDGSGDIRVSGAAWIENPDKHNILCLSPADELHEIGEYHENPPGTTSDDLGTKIMLEFEKPESVDVVVEELQEIKKSLIQNIHLCNNCIYNYPECKPEKLEFGNGHGNDNVIACSQHSTIGRMSLLERINQLEAGDRKGISL